MDRDQHLFLSKDRKLQVFQGSLKIAAKQIYRAISLIQDINPSKIYKEYNFPIHINQWINQIYKLIHIVIASL